MNKKLFFLLLFIPSLMSFNWFKFKTRDHEDIANEITAKIAKKLSTKHKMNWVGDTGGMMGSVYLMGFIFQINHPMEKNEARMRLVDCVEELLSAVNENKEIRPYLKDYPFTTKNLNVAIFITDASRRPVRHPNIGVVSIYKSNDILYQTTVEKQMKYQSETREPYAEALAIVKASSKIEFPQAAK